MRSQIFAPGAASANDLGFATVTAIAAEANDELLGHGDVGAGSERRVYRAVLEDALDRANNDTSFIQPGPCQ